MHFGDNPVSNTLSDTLLKQEQEIESRFKEQIQTEPARAQAIATLGIYKALNTLVRLLAKTADDIMDVT